MTEQMNLKVSTSTADIVPAMTIVETFGATADNLKLIRSYLLKEFQELGDKRVLYLANIGSETVGMVQIIFDDVDGDLTLANGKDIAHVHGLQIAKTHHRKGYGERLMIMVENHLKDAGIKRLTLAVDADNERAIKFYAKLNYSSLKLANRPTHNRQIFYLQKELT